jgi:hypothetical protein
MAQVAMSNLKQDYRDESFLNRSFRRVGTIPRFVWLLAVYIETLAEMAA